MKTRQRIGCWNNESHAMNVFRYVSIYIYIWYRNLFNWYSIWQKIINIQQTLSNENNLSCGWTLGGIFELALTPGWRAADAWLTPGTWDLIKNWPHFKIRWSPRARGRVRAQTRAHAHAPTCTRIPTFPHTCMRQCFFIHAISLVHILFMPLTPNLTPGWRALHACDVFWQHIDAAKAQGFSMKMTCDKSTC